MRVKAKHTKTSEETQTCAGHCCRGDKQGLSAVPRGTRSHWVVGQLTCGMKLAWELEAARRRSCRLWVGFPTGLLLPQAASLTAKMALGDDAFP